MVFISATALLRPLAVHRPVSQSTPCRLRRLVRAATKPPPPALRRAANPVYRIYALLQQLSAGLRRPERSAASSASAAVRKPEQNPSGAGPPSSRPDAPRNRPPLPLRFLRTAEIRSRAAVRSDRAPLVRPFSRPHATIAHDPYDPTGAAPRFRFQARRSPATDRRSRCVSSGLPKYDRGPPSVRIAHLSSGPFPGRTQRLLTNCTVLQVPPPDSGSMPDAPPRPTAALAVSPLPPPKQLRARSRPVRPDFHPPTPRPDPAFTKKSQNNDCS